MLIIAIAVVVLLVVLVAALYYWFYMRTPYFTIAAGSNCGGALSLKFTAAHTFTYAGAGIFTTAATDTSDSGPLCALVVSDAGQLYLYFTTCSTTGTPTLPTSSQTSWTGLGGMCISSVAMQGSSMYTLTPYVFSSKAISGALMTPSSLPVSSCANSC
jgi:hypothetical protein